MLSVICAECPLNNRPHVRQDCLPGIGVLFLGAHPMVQDARHGPFMSKSGALLRQIVNNINREKITHDYAYVCQCVPEFDVTTKKALINAEIYQRCSLIIKDRIERQKPKVLVAMGADVLKVLGFKEKASNLRGGIYEYHANDCNIPIVATYHIVQVHKQPGYLPTFEKDILKAFALASAGLDEVSMDIAIPTEPEKIIQVLDDIKAQAEKNRKETGKPLGLAVDTETTSLLPYLKDERVIAISMSHRNNFGFAYPFEHRACLFDADDFARIKNKTEEILAHPDIAILMANGKFDTQWLKMHYNINMNLMVYDVLLAEHIIDEDKKGEYSLKDLTCDRYPSMGKYEAELKDLLNKAWQAKDAEIARLEKEHSENCDRLILDWWLSLEEDERFAKLAPWVDKGLVDLENGRDLCKVKYRKLKGEMVIPKKYQAAVLKLLKNVPVEEFEKYVTMPELVIPNELTRKTYEDVELSALLKYAAIDAMTTRMIAFDQTRDFARDRAMIERAERETGVKIPTRACQDVMRDNTFPLSDCIMRMEYGGVRIDREKCAKYIEIAKEKMAEAKEELFTEVGRKFSTSSSAPDLGKILYEEMNLPVLKVTESGAPSTDADTIKQLADDYDLPFLQKLLVYRKIDKVLGTYLEPWMKKTEVDGFLRAQFNQLGTATYRLSSSKPNIQNIPFSLKEASLNLKELFIPDSEGFELYELDIANAEMRILTAYSKDEALTRAFNHGKDLHCLTGAGISTFGYDDLKEHKEDKTTEQYKIRQVAKKVNFGVIYCIGPEGLSNQLWTQMRIKETPEQCQEYMDKFFETYPGVKQYIEDTKNFAARFGFTWTFTGRRRRFAIAKYDRGMANRMGRQAVNARIQTTSSDLVMYNLIDMDKWINKLCGRMLLTVHDSLLFQLPKNVGSVGADIKHIITDKTAERAPWLPVTWKFDIGKGPNYGATKGEVA